MIQNANGYRFTTVPFTGEIKGLIVPTADGTASENVIRLENVCYLTEMARETGYWAWPQPYTRAAPNWVGSYDVNKRIIYKSVLDEVADTARLQFGVTSRISKSGSVGVIPMGWTCPLTFPIVRTGSGAFDAMVATMGLPRCSTGVIPVLPETDSLRRAFYDFGQMRRFILCPLSLFSAGARWSDFVTLMKTDDNCLYYHLTGPMVQGDGATTVTEAGQSSDIPGLVTPSMSQEWDSGGSVTYTRTAAAPLCMVVNTYYYREGLTTGTPWLSGSLNGWAVVNGEYRVRGGSNVIYTAVFPITFSLASTVGRTSPFYGIGQAIYNTAVGNQMPQLFTQINSWCAANVENWSRREWLSINLAALYGDSGVLTLPTEIESTGWAWRP